MVEVWHNGTAPTIGDGLDPLGNPVVPRTWTCVAVCGPTGLPTESVFAASDPEGNVYCAGDARTAKGGACVKYPGSKCLGHSAPRLASSFSSPACKRFNKGSACLAAHQVLVLGRKRPSCSPAAGRGPTAPGNWKCVAPCAWKGTASLWVLKTADGGVQCAGPNAGACTWYANTNCNAEKGPPLTSASGLKCQSFMPNTWCTDAYTVVIGNRPAPQCTVARGGNWKCIAPCAGKGKYSAFVSLTATGGVACAGPTGDSCTWYQDARCGGLTAPPASSASGFTCAGYVFGDWCYDGREVLNQKLAVPTCKAPGTGGGAGGAAAPPWKCIAPCAYGGKSSIFVTMSNGNVRCAGSGGSCRWFGNGNCDGLAAPASTLTAGGFGCAGYVVGDWCYDARQTLSTGLSRPTCTAPGDWQCIASCKDPSPSSVLVHKLENGNIQCGSDVPGSCKIFQGSANCNGMSAPPQNWNANGRVCTNYIAKGFCRDAWHVLVAKKTAPGCAGKEQMPGGYPPRPTVKPSTNWAFVLGPYGTAPNNVDKKYSNFFHVTPDSLLPAIKSWDNRHWVFIWSESDNHRTIGTSPFVEDQLTLAPQVRIFGGVKNAPGPGKPWGEERWDRS